MMECQVFCYALSQNDGTEWRQRIQSEAEHFVDVSAMTSDNIARLINQDKIQILINLNGYTKVINNAVHSVNSLSILDISVIVSIQFLQMIVICFSRVVMCILGSSGANCLL
jgi:hypothetical protein